MPLRWLLTLLLLTVSGTPHALNLLAPSTDVLLEPEEAFQVSALYEPMQTLVRWQIASGYYLYRAQFGFTSEDPETHLGTPIFPIGEWVEDEFFGQSEVFRYDITIAIPTEGVQRDWPLTVRFQGCADIGVCYRPQTTTLTVIVP